MVVKDAADLTADARAQIDQMLGIVTALLLLAVIVAVLGIVNTLMLSVVERTRELGLMRAVGATRRQVRAVVRRESVLMALLGAVTGVALGTVAGVALARSLSDQGITSLSVPVPTLAVVPRGGGDRGRAGRGRSGAPGQPGRRAAGDHGRVAPRTTTTAVPAPAGAAVVVCRRAGPGRRRGRTSPARTNRSPRSTRFGC